MSDCLCHESRFQYYCCGVLRIILFCFCCLADIVVKMKDSRFPRISDLPKQFSVSFKISSDDVSFDLTQNKDIDTDVPIYTLNHRGSVELQKMKSSGVNVYASPANIVMYALNTNNALILKCYLNFD